MSRSAEGCDSPLRPHDEDEDVDEVGDKGDLTGTLFFDSSLYLRPNIGINCDCQ